MPRGNDSQAALVDLRGTYGGSSGNAEDLIAAGRHAQSQRLRQASLLPRDHEATAKLLDDHGLDGVEKKVKALPDDAEVIDAAVRGPFIVATVELPSGRTYKEVLDAADLGGPKARRAMSDATEESDEAKAEREAHEDRLRAAADAADAAREAEEAASKAAAKAHESRAKKSDAN